MIKFVSIKILLSFCTLKTDLFFDCKKEKTDAQAPDLFRKNALWKTIESFLFIRWRINFFLQISSKKITVPQ